MVEGEGSSQNPQKSEKGKDSAFTEAIKVLVVHQNADVLTSIANILKSFSFEVACVDHAGSALAILSEKKVEFDLVLIDSHMTDVDTHAFLKITKNMDLLKVVMSEEEDDALLAKALMNGAFLVVRRPLTVHTVKQMRQHVIRERVAKKKAKPREEIARNQSYCNQSNSSNINKRMCVEWTEELHGKFMNAVSQLGEGRCFPKEILELMGVPGLTRMQVASHLQKCRNDRGKAETEKEPSSSSNQTFSVTDDNAPSRISRPEGPTAYQTINNDQHKSNQNSAVRYRNVKQQKSSESSTIVSK